MSKIRRVDFSPDEFLAGTTELDLEETGGYWKVCSLIYSRGGPVADDESWIAAAIVCHVRTWRKIRQRLLAVGKLRLVEIGGQPHLTNGRAERELGRATDRIDNAHRAADESARKRRLARESTVSNGSETLDREPTRARQQGEKQGELLKNNDLGQAPASRHARANHQPSTTKEYVTTTKTEERGATRAKRAPPPPGPKITMDWPLSDELRQWTVSTLAATNAASRVDIERELLKFRTHHVREGTTERGATRAWHTWIFNAIKWSEEDGSSISRQGGRQPQRRSPVATAAALAAGLSRLGDRGSGGEGDPQ